MARSLARNPLGIIGLFLILVYGFAALVATSDTFQPGEREILIWFLVLFPVLVVCLFVYLVTRHHAKLYAPSDFQSSDQFLRLVESQIATSPTVRNLESLMEEVQRRINEQPLYRYTRLSEEGKLVIVLGLKKDSLDCMKLAQERKELDSERMQSQLEVLKEYGWITVEEGIAEITDKGRQEIGTFEEFIYGRLA